MDTSDILRKVRKIEIKTRGLSQNIFAGPRYRLECYRQTAPAVCKGL